MKILGLDPQESLGSVIAQTYNLPGKTISKGTFVTSEIVGYLKEGEVQNILCAVPDDGDIHEDEAANIISNAIDRSHIYIDTASTGRVNFKSRSLCLVRYKRDLIKKVNMVDESIAFSIVEHNQLLAKNDLIATLKIIPFFTQKKYVDQVLSILDKNELFKTHNLNKKEVSLIQTSFEWQKKSMFKATSNVTRNRLEALDCSLNEEKLISHDYNLLRSEIRSSIESGIDILLISGASAIIDRSDYIPKAILSEGGEITQYGLAVDPGNLLLVGKIAETIIIGMPGCARSPKLNGFDWVLQLLMADIPVDKEELAEMGAGGLLMEIASRPLPRALSKSVNKREKKIMGVILAAGNSTRMGKDNKLLKNIDGAPLIRKIALEITKSDLDGCSIVLGYQSDKVADVIKDLNINLILNPLWKEGQASSLKAALNSLTSSYSDLLIMLGDLPGIKSGHINRIIKEHLSSENRRSKITIPSFKGEKGNPVIWGRSFFHDLSNLEGDVGGRVLFGQHPAAINLIEMDDPAVVTDTDTPEDFKSFLVNRA
uniref:Molybdopterin biosynthesis enzyme n=1 Tax=uncultured Rhodobacterales bacterium HF0010_10C01 TaxID=710783 RepID=E0XX16_9RHOB|nr:molybdopterin biosynthesis enzyme [uncultured Rhodobacterales bacterium HF0010_10C01]